MRILLLGDIVGAKTIQYLGKMLWALRRDQSIDMVVANGENASDIMGLSAEDAQALLNYGVDVITGGNHTFHNRSLYSMLDNSPFLLRPANCADAAPGVGSTIFAVKPGDGSAREQAASCQRVIGGLANITKEYATKRYRSNVMNWGMIPFQMVEEPEFEVGDYIYVPGAKAALDGDLKDIKAYVINADTKAVKEISLYVADMTADERKIVKAGCLINYNRARKGLK